MQAMHALSLFNRICCFCRRRIFRGIAVTTLRLSAIDGEHLGKEFTVRANFIGNGSC